MARTTDARRALLRRWYSRPGWMLLGLLSITFALVACFFQSEISIAERAVDHFHGSFNASGYHELYLAADGEFQKVSSESQWTGLLTTVAQRLGRVESDEQTEAHVVEAAGVITVNLIYRTTFSHGSATEDFTYVVRGGKAQLHGYRIASASLK